MAEGRDNVAPLAGKRRLAEAVRAAKIAAAHRSDVVVDIREADRARLEILAEEMQSIVDDVPAGDGFFDFSLSGGPQPRYWVDGTAHVTMARDRRTYRFVRETRLGRVVLAESTSARTIADRMTDYIAERIVEREKAFAGDDLVAPRPPARLTGTSEEPALVAPARRRSGEAAAAAGWLMIGIVIGAAILFAVAALRGFTIN